MSAPCGPCGARQKNRSVVSTRARAASRLTQPCSTPIGYAVRAKPTAATLEKDFDGQRSGVRPLRGFVVSQKKSNVRCERVSTNSRSAGLPAPVATVRDDVGGADAHAAAAARASSRKRFIESSVVEQRIERTRGAPALGAPR